MARDDARDVVRLAAANQAALDFIAGDGGDAGRLPPGEGRVLRINGKKTAAYRDDDGALHLLSPVCTHMGCHVECAVLQRPAVTDLAKR